jgi:hypothetical protein
MSLPILPVNWRSSRVILLVFFLTRLLGVFLALYPQVYTGFAENDVIGDPTLYLQWAMAIIDGRQTPYKEVPIEYPPGVLPFIVAPILPRPRPPYLQGFVGLMVLVDAAGFVGLLRLRQRWGGLPGPWLWALGVPLLGPISWTRLDMIPAVATIWGLERAAASRWGMAGAFLVFGALAKVYPGLLLPAVWFIAPRRGRVAIGVAATVTLCLLPFITSLQELVSSVAGYHLNRGIQFETLWSNGLLVARTLGYEVTVQFTFGANHVFSTVSPALKQFSTILAMTGVAIESWLAFRIRGRGDSQALAVILFAALAWLLVAGSVLSAQFILWVIALGAAAACTSYSRVYGPVLLILPTALLTQLLYPFAYSYLRRGSLAALVAFTARNILLVWIAGWALLVAYACVTRPPSDAEQSRHAAGQGNDHVSGST